MVHTDHKNILYANLANDQIIRWRCLLEECGAEIVHIAGEKNVVAASTVQNIVFTFYAVNFQ